MIVQFPIRDFLNAAAGCSGAAVTAEGGDQLPGVVALPVPYERLDFCHHCQDEMRFLVRYEILDGRVGVCTHCGREKKFPFSRSVSEVA